MHFLTSESSLNLCFTVLCKQLFFLADLEPHLGVDLMLVFEWLYASGKKCSEIQQHYILVITPGWLTLTPDLDLDMGWHGVCIFG